MLNSPTKFPMSFITENCQFVLSKLESSLVQKYPNKYPAWKRSLSLPQFDVILDWGREGNWKEPKKNVQGDDTSHWKVPTFIYKKSEKY